MSFRHFRHFHIRVTPVLKFIMILVTTSLIVVSGIVPAQSQFSLPETTEINRVPADVSSLGNIEVTNIHSPYRREPLFEIASPTVWDRTPPYEDGKLPVEIRAELIESNLRRSLKRLEDPDTVEVVISTLNGATILQVKDNQDEEFRPIYLLTVTEIDAEYYGETKLDVAQSWQEDLIATIKQAVEIRQNSVENYIAAFRVLVGMIAVLVFLFWLYRKLQQRRAVLKLREEKQAETVFQAESESLEAQNPSDLGTVTTEGNEAPSTSNRTPKLDPEPLNNDEASAEQWGQIRSSFLATLETHLTLQRRLEINRFLLWSVFWLQIFVIYSGLIWITVELPRLTPLRNWLLGVPVELALVIFGASFGIRLSRAVIRRFTSSLQRYRFISFGEAQRHMLRLTTIAGVLEGVLTTLIISIAVISLLNYLKVSPSSVLAGGAIVGFAISFGAQSLVKDIINGCFILIEDQFAVGDIIDIGSAAGFVENLNLRITQLRDPEGRLITIPNGTILEVKNLTRLWSRVDFTIVVAYENDPEKVRSLLKDVAFGLYEDPQWQAVMPAPPEVLGIDHLSHEGMLWRVWIKTAPLQQWSVGREFRYRVRVAFAENKIQIGKPQWISYQAELSEANGNGK